MIPLSGGAGEVAAIGNGVTRVKIGDRVAGCFHPHWFGGPIKPEYLTDRLGANLDGMLAEYDENEHHSGVPIGADRDPTGPRIRMTKSSL